MKKFSENYISEGFFDFLKKDKSTKSSGESSLTSWLPFKSFFSSLTTQEKSKHKMSAAEKAAMDYAKKFQDQINKEIQDEIKHEDDVEAELIKLQNQAELNQQKLEHAEKQKQRKQELMALKAANAARKDQERIINAYMKKPEKWDANDLQTELNKLDDIVNSNLTTEQKTFAIDIQSAVYSMCVNEDGSLITGEDLRRKIDNFAENNPELAEKIRKNPEYQKLTDAQSDITAETLEEYLNTKTDPSYESKKAQLNLLSETKSQLSEEHSKLDKSTKKIESTQEIIDKENEKLSSFESIGDGLFEIDDSTGKLKIGDDGKPIIKGSNDSEKKTNVKQFANKRLKQLTEELAIIENNDKTQKRRDAILAEIQGLTGDSNAKIEYNENSGKFTVEANGKTGTDIEISEEKLPDSLNTCLNEYGTSFKNLEKAEKEKADAEKEKADAENRMSEITRNHNNLAGENGVKINENDPMGSCDELYSSLQTSIKETEKQSSLVISKAKNANKQIDAVKKDKDLENMLGSNIDDFKKSLTNDELFPDIHPESEDDANEKDTKKIKIGDNVYSIKDANIGKADGSDSEDDNNAEYNLVIKNAAIISQPIPPEPSKPDENASPEEKKKYAEDILKRQEMIKRQTVAKEELKESLKAKGVNDSEKVINKLMEGDNDDLDDVMGELSDEFEEDEDQELNDNSDVEAVDDEEGQSKQAEDVKNGKINPAKLFKRRKRKDGKGTTKSYYHIKNKEYSLSPKEYKEAVARYKQNNESHIPSLKNYILEKLNK